MPTATAPAQPRQIPTNSLLDPREAADYLRIKVQTLANWRMNGRGPEYVRIGRLVRYRVAQLEAWIAGAEGMARGPQDGGRLKTTTPGGNRV